MAMTFYIECWFFENVEVFQLSLELREMAYE